MPKLVPSASEFVLSPTLAANEEVARRRAGGETVLHMGFGESPFPVAERLKKALINAAEQKAYLPTGGMEELCSKIKEYYSQRTDIDVEAYDIMVAPGSKLILYALQMAIEGDLLMPVPSWVSYAPQSMMLGRKTIHVPMHLGDDGLYIDAQELRDTVKEARSKGMNPTKIILNAPSNPTGLKFTPECMEPLAKACCEEDILMISDEIYGFVSFDNQYQTISKYAPQQTAVTTGLSKHLSLGGWRVGVGFIPKAINGLNTLMNQIASETWSCASAPIQQACITAYEGHEDIEKYINDCTSIHAVMNRYISRKLREAGIDCPMPQGAFYNYPNFENSRDILESKGITTSRELSDYLLHKYGLVTLPGSAFGAEPEALTLRLSGCDYDGAYALEKLQQGVELNDEFVSDVAPNIKEAVNAFADLAGASSSDKSRAAA